MLVITVITVNIFIFPALSLTARNNNISLPHEAWKNKTNLTIYPQCLVSFPLCFKMSLLLPWNPGMQRSQDAAVKEDPTLQAIDKHCRRAPCDPAHSRGNKPATGRCSSRAGQLSNHRDTQTPPIEETHQGTVGPRPHLTGFSWCFASVNATVGHPFSTLIMYSSTCAMSWTKTGTTDNAIRCYNPAINTTLHMLMIVFMFMALFHIMFYC